jgi:hypothetical protein
MHGLILNLDRKEGRNTFTKIKNTWVPREGTPGVVV